ncbi:MAG: hypothetical protein ACFUZC_20360 [Chthoniobacteraceae bacterium]
MAYSLCTLRFILLAMILACGASLPLAAAPAPSPEPLYGTDAAQLELLQARCDERDQKVVRLLTVLGVLSLFGAVCAIWAYRTCRNVVLWFGIGFVLNIISFLLIGIVTRRNRGRKRYRRFISYWYASR